MIRTAALVLTVLTGFTGLVYQIAWQKYLAVLLGSHAEATAAVLGIFLGGLSLGYALFGRLSGRLMHRSRAAGRAPPLLFAYGVVEGGIGLYALLFSHLFTAAQALSLQLPHVSETLAFGLDVGLTILLIGPPTLLMGGTIPLLTQGLSRSLDDATRLHAFVYGFNTVGAFGGALAAGFYLVPTLGLKDCVATMGWLNLFAGLFFVVAGSLSRSGIQPESADGGRTPAGLHRYALAAGLSGFAMMTLQTALNRIGALSLGASHFTFAMVVAVFVSSIAAGSLAVSALPRVRPSYLILSQWALVAILLGAYVFVPDAPYWALRVRSTHPSDAENFYPYYASVFGWSLLLMLVPIGLSGATLPLIFHHLRREVGDLGATAGRLYAWNTLGSLLGALLGGYLLLFWVDLHHTYRFAVGALALGAALLTGLVYPSRRHWGAVTLGAAVVCLALLPPWPATKLSSGLFRAGARPEAARFSADELDARTWRDSSILFYEDDPSISVAVTRHPRPPAYGLALMNNGKSDSSLPGDQLTTGMLGLLPAILTERPENAFVIGYGTGHTVGTLATLDSMREVVVAEISSGVLAAAPFFEERNFHAATNPKTRLIRSDAYRALLRSDTRYDLIVSEPSNPWVAGVEMLYSIEFLRAARSRLTPQGVYAQFFHFYETDDATVELVLDTYLQVFERVGVWASNTHDLILIGLNDDDYVADLAVLERRFEQPDYRAVFRSLDVDAFPEFLAHEIVPLGTFEPKEPAPRVHMLLHPILSDFAARAFFISKVGIARLPSTTARRAARVGAESSLVSRYWKGVPAAERETVYGQLVAEVCEYYQEICLTWMARWRHDAPDSPALARALAESRSVAPSLAETLSEKNLVYLSQLWDPGGVKDVPPTFESAEIVLGLFERFYHHAIPFDARALQAAFRRCSDDARCRVEADRIEGIGITPTEGGPARSTGG